MNPHRECESLLDREDPYKLQKPSKSINPFIAMGNPATDRLNPPYATTISKTLFKTQVFPRPMHDRSKEAPVQFEFPELSSFESLTSSSPEYFRAPDLLVKS